MMTDDEENINRRLRWMIEMQSRLYGTTERLKKMLASQSDWDKACAPKTNKRENMKKYTLNKDGWHIVVSSVIGAVEGMRLPAGQRAGNYHVYFERGMHSSFTSLDLAYDYIHSKLSGESAQDKILDKEAEETESLLGEEVHYQ